ncbi:MAG: T9SS type A sorting domain-containing protein, partial [Bacteroidetes bacterium]|nr:T9SS type A sorting domain-containing protein [Bacteroidota bacterium]
PMYKFGDTVKFSSGLFRSPDYGETWNIEASTEYINTVNIDFSGNVFAGWHNSPNLAESSEGIAKFDTTSHEFTFINNGLPNKNINKIKFELGFLGCYIYMYCCTDSGVYYTNNYLTEINDINNSSAFAISNYPNPFNSFTTFEYTISEKLNTNISFVIYDLQGQKIKEFPYLNRSEGNYTLEFDASSLKSGIYCYILRAGNNIISRKINCIK